MTTIKDHAVERTAGSLRMSATLVRLVVDEYEKQRSAVNREQGASSKKPTGKKTEPGIKSLGGGWYEVDGQKYHGREAALAAVTD